MAEQDEKPCGAHEEAIKTLKDSDRRQWLAIEKLQNRLPTWATLLISVLTFGLGWSLSYAITAVRIAGAVK